MTNNKQTFEQKVRSLNDSYLKRLQTRLKAKQKTDDVIQNFISDLLEAHEEELRVIEEEFKNQTTVTLINKSEEFIFNSYVFLLEAIIDKKIGGEQ